MCIHLLYFSLLHHRVCYCQLQLVHVCLSVCTASVRIIANGRAIHSRKRNAYKVRVREKKAKQSSRFAHYEYRVLLTNRPLPHLYPLSGVTFRFIIVGRTSNPKAKVFSFCFFDDTAAAAVDTHTI